MFDMSYSVSGIEFCPPFRKIGRMISWTGLNNILRVILVFLPLCESWFHTVRELYTVHLNILRKDKGGLLVTYTLEYPVLLFKELKPIRVFVIRIKNYKILVLNLQKFVL